MGVRGNRCKVKVSKCPILHLGVNEYMFAPFQFFLKAIVVYFSKFLFFIGTCRFYVFSPLQELCFCSMAGPGMWKNLQKMVDICEKNLTRLSYASWQYQSLSRTVELPRNLVEIHKTWSSGTSLHVPYKVPHSSLCSTYFTFFGEPEARTSIKSWTKACEFTLSIVATWMWHRKNFYSLFFNVGICVWENF